MPIDIKKAVLIPGWMSEHELQWLGEQAANKKLIIEIGSYMGRSTRVMGDATSGRVVAVDDWFGPRNESDVNTDGTPFTEDERSEIEAKFHIYLSDLIQAGKVLPVKMDYNEMEYSEELDVQPDMVFIDGDHSYEAVMRDISLWRERLVSGGMLCGHDFGYEPIMNALKDSRVSFTHVPNTSIWLEVKA